MSARDKWPGRDNGKVYSECVFRKVTMQRDNALARLVYVSLEMLMIGTRSLVEFTIKLSL